MTATEGCLKSSDRLKQESPHFSGVRFKKVKSNFERKLAVVKKFKNWIIKKFGGYTRTELDEYIQVEKDRVETKYEFILRDKEKEFSKKLKEEVEKAQGTMKVVDVPCGTETIQLKAELPYGFPEENYSTVLEQLKCKIPDRFFDVQTCKDPAMFKETLFATVMVANPKDFRTGYRGSFSTVVEPPKYFGMK